MLKINEELQTVNADIHKLEGESNEVISKLYKKDAIQKSNYNKINKKFDEIKDEAIAEKSTKDQGLALALEQLSAVKKENENLKEEWLKANNELFNLENEYYSEFNKARETEKRAKYGIGNLQKLYDVDKRRDEYLIMKKEEEEHEQEQREARRNKKEKEKDNNEDKDENIQIP